MNRFQCTYDSVSLVPDLWQQQIRQAQTSFLSAYQNSYSNSYSFINAPFDTASVAQVYTVVQEKKQRSIKMLIVIGIGGSNLGTKAVHEFLHGVYYNDADPEMRCYFVDTIDADTIRAILQRMEHVLSQGHDILINVISKSGTTTETLINFNLFLSRLKAYRPDTYRACIVITSDTESKFAQLAEQEQFTLLEIPSAIGGRYSVFTAVGLFPLAMLGVDLEQLLMGAQTVITDVLSTIDNDATRAAYVSYDHCANGKNIHDMFVFDTSLTSLGLWHRQLVGESLGKRTDIGITPTVSVGSTDLHSVGQLYLGGPRDKYTMFVAVGQHNDIQCEVQHELRTCMPPLKKNSFEFVMNAIIAGTQKAYAADNRPFESCIIPHKQAAYIGQFLQWYMMRIVYMAHLLRVNPFDQPHVELYKDETRKIIRAVRAQSRKTGGNYGTKIVSLLRNKFGGHNCRE